MLLAGACAAGTSADGGQQHTTADAGLAAAAAALQRLAADAAGRQGSNASSIGCNGGPCPCAECKACCCSQQLQQAESAALFQHPLAPPQQRRGRQVAERAHTEMQHWLEGYFNSSASQLTSTRLQAAQVRHTAVRAAAAVAATAAAPQAEPAAGGAVDVPSLVPRCDAACSRASAAEVLAARERHGKPLPLRWQPFFRGPPALGGHCQWGEQRRRRLPATATQGESAKGLSGDSTGGQQSGGHRQVCGPLVGRKEQWVPLLGESCQPAVVPRIAEAQDLVQTCAAPLPLLLPLLVARAGGSTTLPLQPLTSCCCTTATPASCAARTARR